MSNVEDQIRSRVQAFAAELANLVRRAAYEAVHASLGAPTHGARPAAGPGRSSSRRGAAAKPTPRAATRGRPPAAGKQAGPAKPVTGVARKPGQKRDPRDLARLVERLADYVRANPGQRIEQINRALGVPTKDLTLPIRKLLVSHRITSKGEKRATSYWPK